jgi:hypothetical protein
LYVRLLFIVYLCRIDEFIFIFFDFIMRVPHLAAPGVTPGAALCGTLWHCAALCRTFLHFSTLLCKIYVKLAQRWHNVGATLAQHWCNIDIIFICQVWHFLLFCI